MKIKHLTYDEAPDFIQKRGFLFFPKTIKDETRWLEYAEWVQSKTPLGNRQNTKFWYEYWDFCWGSVEEIEEENKKRWTGIWI